MTTLRQKAEAAAMAIFDGHDADKVPYTRKCIADAIEAEARAFAAEVFRRMFKFDMADWSDDKEDWSVSIVSEQGTKVRTLLGCGCCADRWHSGADCKEKAQAQIDEAAAEALDAAARGE